MFTQNSLSFVTEYLNGRNETYSVALEDILSLRLIENSSLYLIFKNVIKKSICVCLIPSFGTSTQLATINSAWNTCSISSIRGVDSEDLYDVLWSGLGNKGPEMCKNFVLVSDCISYYNTFLHHILLGLV